jgi:membrane protein
MRKCPYVRSYIMCAYAPKPISVQPTAAAGDEKRVDVLSPWNLRRYGVAAIARRTWASMSEDDLTGRAAQLAYYFFFALFPGLVAASAVLGLVASSGKALSTRLIDYIGNVIPASAFEIVSDTFRQTAHASSGSKVVIGLAVALWSASAGTSAIQSALNSVYKVKESRPFWKARLLAIILTVAMGALFTAALTALLGGDIVVTRLGKVLNAHLFLLVATRLMAWPLAFALVAIGFALVYSTAPNVKQAKWRWITPGSIVGISLWLLASTGLRVYLHFFNSYSLTYGSLGAVIVLLTWFYLSGLALLLGAEINVVIEVVAAEHGARAPEDYGEKALGSGTVNPPLNGPSAHRDSQ